MITGRRRRRAGVYITTLGCALLVALIGVSSVLAVRAQQRGMRGTQDFIAARHLAQSAVDCGLYALRVTPDWRTTFPNGAWFTNVPLARGNWSLSGYDLADDDLTDDPAEVLTLRGQGVCGEARYVLQVTLTPALRPLSSLQTCLESGGYLYVWPSMTLTVKGAPAATNSSLYNYGTITGNAEATSVALSGTVSGSLTAPAANRDLPDSGIFDKYVDLSRSIPRSSTMQRFVLSPSSNPWGATNADGVYYLDTGNQDVTIRYARIVGTLVVRDGGGTLTIGPGVLLSPARPDYPALVVDGDLVLSLSSASMLRESDQATNYNPTGTPYGTQSDSDTADSYPSEIRGLVHVGDDLGTSSDSRVRGTVIVYDNAWVSDNLDIIYDPDANNLPTQHYVVYDAPYVVTNSWQQSLDP